MGLSYLSPGRRLCAVFTRGVSERRRRRGEAQETEEEKEEERGQKETGLPWVSVRRVEPACVLVLFVGMS